MPRTPPAEPSRLHRLSTAALAAAALAPPAWAQPANDHCWNATPLPLNGSVSGSMAGATASGTNGNCAGPLSPDVWHTVVVPCRGDLTLYTCPVAFDSVLALHLACPSGGVSHEWYCNDNSLYCGASYPQASAFTAPVNAATYLVRLSRWSGGTGQTYTLNSLFVPAAPPNDHCASALPIGEGSISGSTFCGATPDGSAACGSSNGSPDVWYRYTATCDGLFHAGTCPASYDTVVSAHSGCPGTAANQLACSDDSPYCGTAYPRTSYVSFPVTAGNSYLIRVSGWNTGAGEFTLNTWLDAPGCPVGACCRADGTCAVVTLAQCAGSAWWAGAPCESVTCTSPCDWISGSLPGGSLAWPSTEGVQTTRLFQDGVPDTCALAAPGGSPVGGSYRYVKYDFANTRASPACISFEILTSCAGASALYAGAYIGPYNPAAPWQNNVASIGASPNTGSAANARMSFDVPAGTPFSVVISEVESGGCGAYSFRFGTELCAPPPACYPNCDASTTAPALNVADFTCFLQKFAGADPYANCDASTTPPVLNVADFTCFLQKFAAGCP